jgi:hypothetical protein
MENDFVTVFFQNLSTHPADGYFVVYAQNVTPFNRRGRDGGSLHIRTGCGVTKFTGNVRNQLRTNQIEIIVW